MIYLYAYIHIYLSIYLSMYRSIYLSIYLSICVHLAAVGLGAVAVALDQAALSFPRRKAPHELISHTVLSRSFSESQFPHKSVNLFFISKIVKDKLTDLRGS